MADYAPTMNPAWPGPIKPGAHAVTFDKSTAADHAIVAAPTDGSRIRLISWVLYIAAGNTLTFKSGSSTIAGMVFEFGGQAYWQSGVHEGLRVEAAANTALNLTLGSAQQVKGSFIYDYVHP